MDVLESFLTSDQANHHTMKLQLFTCVVFFALVSVSCQPQASERVSGWNRDLDHFIAQVKQHHYVYRSMALPTAFDQQASTLRENLGVYSDQRILLEFEKLAAMLGDGHTYVLPWAAQKVEARGLPFRFYLFADGLFIIDAPEKFAHLIGSKVLKLGEVTADQAMHRIAPYVSRDNETGIRWIGPVFLSFQGGLEAVGVYAGKGSVSVQLRNRRQEDLTVTVELEPLPPLRGVPKLLPSKIAATPPPLYLEQVAQTFRIKSLRQRNQPVVYAQFNQVMDDPQETLAAFSTRLGDTLRATLPANLIVDVRHNNGGNADLLPPLLETLMDYKQSRPGSKIFILTGRNTFSAAQIFISKADALLKPVFVGEPSSSKPNFVGEENEVILPYSGAICSISNRYHESIPNDKREWIEPEITVLLSSVDYFDNRDPVLERILAD
jgi:hypothetical protein